MGNRRLREGGRKKKSSFPQTERGNESLAMMGGDLYHFPGDNVSNWIGKQGGPKFLQFDFKPKTSSENVILTQYHALL